MNHEKTYGRNAALALFDAAFDDVVRIAYTEAARPFLGDALREAARRRIPYAEIDEPALSRLAESLHHEGVVVIRKPRTHLDGPTLFTQLERGVVRRIVALDHVTNPHNIGAILRSAAFLGLDAVALHGTRTSLTPAAVRISEGAAERIPIAFVPDLPDFLDAVRRERVPTLGADARGRMDAMRTRWPDRGVLVLGNEGQGLSPEVSPRIDTWVRVGGSGRLESLNVSVAAGILFAAWCSASEPTTTL